MKCRLSENKRRDKKVFVSEKYKKSKMAAWGGLTKSCEEKRSEKQIRKGKM